jgi:hypothetical protein
MRRNPRDGRRKSVLQGEFLLVFCIATFAQQMKSDQAKSRKKLQLPEVRSADQNSALSLFDYGASYVRLHQTTSIASRDEVRSPNTLH